MYSFNLSDSYAPPQSDTPLEPLTIGDRLRRSAATWPQHMALREVELSGSFNRSWTYEELLRDSEHLAGVLAARHEKGARVAIWAPNIPEWVLLEFGLAMAGITLVTVNPSLQARELDYILRQSGAEAIYYIEAFRGNPMGQIVNEVCDTIPAIRQRIIMDDHEALFAGPKKGLPDVMPDDEVQIQYTSGTTGFPKGAVLHHHGLVQNACDVMRRNGQRPGDRMVNYMPMFHTTGCSIMTLGIVGGGGEMILMPMFDPALAAHIIEHEGAAFVFGVPTMLVALIEEARKENYAFSSVRGVGSGGSMVSPELAKAAKEVFDANVQIVYGQTESSPVITMAWADDNLIDSIETIGQPLPHVEVSIRDPHSNEVLPLETQGEICTRGYLVMHEYNNNPEASAAAIDSQGWLHTGDLGSMDGRGFVKITGRVKEMIIRGGENLFPVEIENAMLEHPAIAEIAVVGIPDEKWGEQIACFMRHSGAGARPDTADLKAFIRERLSPQKTPVYWIWVTEWPLTGSGKIQKFRLAEQFSEGKWDVLTV